MSDTLTTGWGNYSRMSPRVRAACIADDREAHRARQAEERQRAARADYLEQSRIRAALELAEERGEVVSLAEVGRTNGACLGRTRQEFIAEVSAQQDAEDARAAARTRAAGEYDAARHQAALLAISPTAGRTRQEAIAYYSAVADVQDYEAARRAQQGLPTADAEAAARELLEKREATIAGRARDRHTRVVARGAAQRALRDDKERAYLDGEITAEQLAAAGRGLA
jgi:hypothetical protein